MRTACSLCCALVLLGSGSALARHRPAHPARPAPARVRAPPPPAAPEVVFTFDDGPDLVRTPKVLETLDAYHVKAVFFVNGVRFMGNAPNAEKARQLLREVLRRGHYVGNHTVHHKFLCGQAGPKIAGEEILRNADLIEQVVGLRPELYRTPYGAHCRSLQITLDRLGIRHTGWDIDPQDWKVRSTARVRDEVIRQLKQLRGRAIVLLHDVHSDTVEALPQILAWIAKENQARTARGEAPIRILDYTSLLPPRPNLLEILQRFGGVLIDGLPGAVHAWQWLSRWMPSVRS